MREQEVLPRRIENKVHYPVEIGIGQQTCQGELIILPKLPEPGQDPQPTEILFFYPQTQRQAVYCTRQLTESVFSGRVVRKVDPRFGSKKDFAQQTFVDGFCYTYNGIVWKRRPWSVSGRLLREGLPWERGGQFGLSFSLSRWPAKSFSRQELMLYMDGYSPQKRAEFFMRALENHSSGIIRNTKIIPHG